MALYVVSRQLFDMSMHCPTLTCDVFLCLDARIKSKFWGKSMEVFPVGTINVTLPK